MRQRDVDMEGAYSKRVQPVGLRIERDIASSLLRCIANLMKGRGVCSRDSIIIIYRFAIYLSRDDDGGGVDLSADKILRSVSAGMAVGGHIALAVEANSR